MTRMAQEIQAVTSGSKTGAVSAEQASQSNSSKQEGETSLSATEQAAVRSLESSSAILSALGDEPSRRILIAAVARGKTVEEISEEEGLPLSTCYRRVGRLLARGLMIVERSVITPAGKRHAVYRTTFSGATIRLYNGALAIEATPNPDVVDKLHRKWLSANFPVRTDEEPASRKAGSCSELIEKTKRPLRVRRS